MGNRVWEPGGGELEERNDNLYRVPSLPTGMTHKYKRTVGISLNKSLYRPLHSTAFHRQIFTQFYSALSFAEFIDPS